MSEEITLIVPAESTVAGEVGDDFQPHASTESMRLAAMGLVKPKSIDYERLREELAKVQSQMARVIEGADTPEKGGFGLDEVQVSLAISGEGSIGVVTAGIEGSISLTFKRQR